MTSLRTHKFKKLFKRLPDNVQAAAEKSYRNWFADPTYPAVNFELVDEEDRIWSARVTEGYRALCTEEGGVFIWFWIGTHGEYDRLIG